MTRAAAALAALALIGCGKDEGVVRLVFPTVSDVRELVPGTGMPAEADIDRANNNLDAVEHGGRTYLAFRTAPNHFASPETRMLIVSTLDFVSWDYEGEFALGTDVREPNLVSWNGELYLYFAVLGQDPADFTPVGTRYSKYLGPGQWSEIQNYPIDTFIAWRIKELDGTLYLTGYAGGENIYDPVDPEPIEIHWGQSTDAVTWTGVAPQGTLIQEGGGSEMDFVFLDDGRGIAVIRNEAGDEDGFGSKICEIAAGNYNDWNCATDRRKFDSPNVFRHGDDVWLIARRNLTDTGYYDVSGAGDLEEAYLENQLAYWKDAKRCSLWKVDTDTLEVTLYLDLPSKGDTCFPEVLPVDGDPDSFHVYNYSNELDGEDYDWLDGQLEPTNIYRMTLTFP